MIKLKYIILILIIIICTTTGCQKQILNKQYQISDYKIETINITNGFGNIIDTYQQITIFYYDKDMLKFKEYNINEPNYLTIKNTKKNSYIIIKSIHINNIINGGEHVTIYLNKK
ncbi:MAG: hypothetical protein LIR50_15590 [Bacillota bacterium]|nr:hypothetical protein [Bacillota bacterium]